MSLLLALIIKKTRRYCACRAGKLYFQGECAVENMHFPLTTAAHDTIYTAHRLD